MKEKKPPGATDREQLFGGGVVLREETTNFVSKKEGVDLQDKQNK
jgi:hypothetical protein